MYLSKVHPCLRTLHKIVTEVWKEEVVPEEWHQGIIIPLYKGKGSKSECSNYRGITLLSVPGKVFAHIILARIKPTCCHTDVLTKADSRLAALRVIA